MPTLQSLKKQLRSVRSTWKLTKAMKTVSTVKFSKLSATYAKYSEYGRRSREMFEKYGEEILSSFKVAESDAPPLYIVMASNRGLCGAFNSELLTFAKERLEGVKNYRLAACGKKAISFFKVKGIPIWKEYIFGDVPTYEEAAELFSNVLLWRERGEISDVYVIYPKYENMLIHRPCVSELFSSGGKEGDDMLYIVPDRATVAAKTARPVLSALFYELILETALGAQAATLMTMRSAFDTATEYCARLEGQINRMRQSAVTADVIETSVETE